MYVFKFLAADPKIYLYIQLLTKFQQIAKKSKSLSNASGAMRPRNSFLVDIRPTSHNKSKLRVQFSFS